MATKMKSSGIAWIGEIPKGWGIKKITHLFNIIGSGTTPLSSNPDYYNGEINWVNTGDLNDGVLYSTERKITEVALADYSTLKQFKEGSLIIAMYGATIGKVSILGIKAATNQACCVLSDPVGVITKYVYYWFISNRDNVISLALGGGQPNISQDLIRSLRIPIPGEKEQRAIINYLDQKCGDIDKVISAKQRQNELLKEQRQSIIYEAVTKGLNKNVKYKDSGIEWIGEIPEDWEICKIKYICDIDKNRLPENTDENFLFNYIDISSVTELGGIGDTIRMSFKESPSRARMVVSENDIIISTVRTYLRAIAFITENDKYICSTGFAVLTPKENLNSKFAFYQVQSEYIVQEIVRRSVGVSYPAITATALSNISLIIPPLSIQRVIADYLDQKCAAVDRIINANNDMIEKLQEYRQSIVYEAVTGKIDI